MNNKDYLIDICKKNAPSLGVDFNSSFIKERFEYEINIIEQGNLFDYFLIIWDLVKWARDNDILVGPGRGSAAGSLVSYLLKITEVNPLDYGLIFERFLNPTRFSAGAGAADIDLDFQKSRRDEVIEYIHEKYGRDCVAAIPTFMHFGVRSSLRDLARIESVPIQEVDLVTKKIPDNMPLQDAMKLPEVKAFCAKYPRIGRLLPELEGSIRHRGKHAAGLVITPGPVDDYLSFEKVTQTDCVCFDKDDIEEMGLLKADILGLKTLDIIADTIKFVKEQQGIDVELPKTYDDPKVFRLFRDGNLFGVFQFKTQTLTDFSMKVGIEDFKEIYDTTSIVRPGTLHSGDAEKYIKTKFSLSGIQYIHTLLEEILSPTQGVIVYQEQLMEIVNKIGGLSLVDGERIRKLVAKSKGVEELDKYREAFVDGAKKKKISIENSNAIWDSIREAGAYLFNKSHAVVYSIISYRTAWLKIYYPKEFLAANIKWEKEEKKMQGVEEARKLGFNVSTPDINKSEEYTSITEDGDILFGLYDIDQVGEKAVSSILKNRPYKSFEDFMNKRTPNEVNIRVVRNLVMAGAFDWDKRRDELYYIVTPDETPEPWEDQDMYLRQLSVLDLPPSVPLISFFENPFPVDTIPINNIKWDEIRDEIYVEGMIMSVAIKTGYGYMNINDGTGTVNVLMGEEILEQYKDIIHGGVGTPVLVKAHMVQERTRLYADMIVPLDNYDNYDREVQYFEGSTEIRAKELEQYTSDHIGVVVSSNYFTSKKGNKGTRISLSNGFNFMCFDKKQEVIRAGDIITYKISKEPFINVQEVR